MSVLFLLMYDDDGGVRVFVGPLDGGERESRHEYEGLDGVLVRERVGRGSF